MAVFCDCGYGIAFTFGGGADNDYDNDYDSPSKKNRWEVHAQGGRLGTGKWLMQGTTIFTLKELFGFGAVWQYPNNNLSALAALTIGSIKLDIHTAFMVSTKTCCSTKSPSKSGFRQKKKWSKIVYNFIPRCFGFG